LKTENEQPKWLSSRYSFPTTQGHSHFGIDETKVV
jgi:hypothetical protein